MNKNVEDEPEDAGLIQSKPPTRKELREISLFIAQSKRRNAVLVEGVARSVRPRTRRAGEKG